MNHETSHVIASTISIQRAQLWRFANKGKLSSKIYSGNDINMECISLTSIWVYNKGSISKNPTTDASRLLRISNHGRSCVLCRGAHRWRGMRCKHVHRCTSANIYICAYPGRSEMALNRAQDGERAHFRTRDLGKRSSLVMLHIFQDESNSAMTIAGDI